MMSSIISAKSTVVQVNRRGNTSCNIHMSVVHILFTKIPGLGLIPGWKFINTDGLLCTVVIMHAFCPFL